VEVFSKPREAKSKPKEGKTKSTLSQFLAFSKGCADFGRTFPLDPFFPTFSAAGAGLPSATWQ
jgi:hypothetical protein